MLNRITIMGRLTRDPESRLTSKGDVVASFTVAVDRDYSGRDGGEKQTDFIDCVAWRKTAEFIIKYFQKGSMIAVDGRMEIDSWADKDGNKRKSAKINVSNAYFGSSKSGSSSGNSCGGNTYGSYPETQAAIDSYMGGQSYPPAATVPDDYAMLTDDDAQLPF